MVAGIVYPALAALVIAVTFVVIERTIPPLPELVGILVGVGGMVIGGGLLGMVVAILLCGPVLLTVWAVNRWLNLKASYRALGATGGGLVGYVALAPFFANTVARLLRGSGLPGNDIAGLFFLLLGPVLAMFCGQVGGAYGALAVERQREFLGLPAQPRPARRYTFSLRQALGLTLVVSVALTLLRLTGLLNTTTFVVVALWFVCQTLARRPAIRLARWLLHKRRYDLHLQKYFARPDHTGGEA